MADFVRLLDEFREWAGAPSYRTLAKRVGPLMRPPRPVSQSTVGEVFRPRRRRLDVDLVVALVRAMGADESTVARWRDACVAVHVEAKSGGASSVLRQLPPNLATFSGRAEPLARLIDTATGSRAGDARSDDTRTVVVCAIEGMAGIGKTQLAVHAAHHLVRDGWFTDAQLYVNLHGFDPDQPPSDPARVLDGLLRQLGVPSQQIPTGLDALAAMFRDRLTGRSTLILLDNAAGESQVRDLIPSSPDCLVLVTSRRSLAGLDGASVYPLDTFSVPESLDLLSRIAGADRVPAGSDAAVSVVEACGGLPLALALAAARLRSRPSWSIADLAERLRIGGLDGLKAGGRSLRVVLDLSYQGLASPEQRVFRLLGLHPGSDFTAPMVAALADMTSAEAESLLESLQDENLVQQREPGRYSFHDLVRRYSQEAAAEAETEQSRRAAVRRLVDWHVHAAAAAMHAIAPHRRAVHLTSRVDHALLPTPANGQAGFDWCDRELRNLVAAVRLAHEHGFHDAAWQLPTSLQYYLGSGFRREEFAQTHELGLKSARRIGSAEGEARLQIGLGNLRRMEKQYGEAVEAFSQALAVFQRDDDGQGELTAVLGLAGCHQEIGNLTESLRWFDRALGLEWNNRDTYLRAATLNNRGEALRLLGHLDEARTSLERALELYDDDSDNQARAYILGGIGTVSAEQGDLRAAADYLRQAAELHEHAGRKPMAAEVFEELGTTLHAAGDEQEARAAWEHALELLGQMDHAEVVADARRLEALIGRIDAP